MELKTAEEEVFEVFITGSEQATAGILIIHDWWGVLEYNHQWATQLAALGYQTMVIDLYEGYHPQDTKAAGEFMRNIDQEAANRKLQTALQQLRTNDKKVGVLGWSFGGLQAQQMALLFPQLVDALIIFYCRILIDKEKAKTIHCPTLAIFSETERTWPDKQAALEHAMSEAGKILECHSYDADHGFANPESPRYDNQVTEDAWLVTVKFLEKYLSTT